MFVGIFEDIVIAVIVAKKSFSFKVSKKLTLIKCRKYLFFVVVENDET